MRIVRSSDQLGAMYRIYRDDDDFVAQMKRLMPFLAQCDGEVSIGGTNDDPDVVLIVGPLDGSTDHAFQKHLHGRAC